MMQYFEWKLPNDGMLWKQLKNDAKHLYEIGITAVWIPPAYKADEQQDEGYGTYDLFDLGEFDQKGTVRTKYGTKNELLEAIEELHKNGISVYLDAVMNHKTKGDYTEEFSAVEVDPKQRYQPIGKEHIIQGWTGYSFYERGNKYSDFKWHWYHFTATEFDDKERKSGIFKIIGEGKDWDKDVDPENGNFDFLLGNDIDLNHPEVVGELNKWGVWVSDELQLDGMRLDAVKHMDSLFIKQFLENVRKTKGEQFFAVAEYWKGDFDSLHKYLEEINYSLNLFDVPLHFKMFQASLQGKNFDITKFTDNTLVTRYPQNAVTFVDNHDTQKGGALESEIQSWLKPQAYALILLMETGYPCIFYGDYYGIGGEPSPHKLIIEILLDARRKYAYGAQTDYFDHPNTVGFVRLGDEAHPDSGLAVVFSNSDDGYKIMNVGKNRQGETWREITGSIPDTIIIDNDGNGSFTVKGGKFSVWVRETKS